MVLYADILFLINLAADYLLLMASGSICAVFAPKWRIALASCLGASYAVLAALGADAFSNFMMWILCCAMMLVIAFGADKRIWRIGIVFLAVSAAFGGVFMVVGMMFGRNTDFEVFASPSVAVFLLTFVLVYTVVSAVFKRSCRGEGKLSKVEIYLGTNFVTLSALQDTGNSLSDPLTGRKVLVTGCGEVKKLFPVGMLGLAEKCGAVEFAEIMNALDTDCRFLLVPYKAVGTESGMLAAFKPDKMIIDGKRDDTYLVALSPNGVSDGGSYTALMGAA